ncbi:MAG: hypothetical protein RLZZ528_1372 [Pseudomonadota bacterium]
MNKRHDQLPADLPTDLLSILARSSSRLVADFAGMASLVVMLVVALNLPELI